mmetsp:Transcript_19921/g.32792  ORF Transcript_19921/g.32792 Transcript_19921/m.32792 type:complete len:494 (-) Transcript_19921:554-2035(-)|eukprot:CAMPEP_0203754162 /NCGR_PEP_ID=MMETSP0098-20131031/7800_1 /ASSEMBLY_ACC=CAM_ASM_000208 /TAXON_ID=96639 /ORGANISM=" , Strain NY0313808BC1" /LENGTH=493 /DNA_ID=CAMNT_0050645047 /DNA_START=194 /DNA_END=1675 /DNA_ORIENTATION=-
MSSKKDNFPVVLCGGSNGTAYFSGLWSSGRLPSGAHPVRVVTHRPERFKEPLTVRESYQPGKGTALGDSVAAPISWQKYKSGKVDAYNWDNLATAFRDVACIWICAPVNAYGEMLEKIMPAAAAEAKRTGRTKENPLLVCVMYAQGGVDWLALSKIGGKLPEGLGLCLLKNFPALISRTSDTLVQNFGYHPNCAWFAPVPKSAGKPAARMLKVLFASTSQSWAVQELSTPLLCTLGGSNQLLHPTIIGGLLGDAPGRTFDEQPKVYRNLPWKCFDLMGACWQETMALGEALEEKLQLSIMDKIGNTSVVRNVMKLYAHKWPRPLPGMLTWGAIYGSSRLRAAKMPIVPNPFKDDEISRQEGDEGEYVLNVDHRFIVDDVPYGLCVIYGIAAIVGCPMPETGKLIADLQLYLKKEYVVVKGARFVLEGRDAMETGAPQAYGVKTLEQLRSLVVDEQLPYLASEVSDNGSQYPMATAVTRNNTNATLPVQIASRL